MAVAGSITSPSDSGTIPDRVFSLLREAIVEGAIQAGSKISEPELARSYGISRGALREAIGAGPLLIGGSTHPGEEEALLVASRFGMNVTVAPSGEKRGRKSGPSVNGCSLPALTCRNQIRDMPVREEVKAISRPSGETLGWWSWPEKVN